MTYGSIHLWSGCGLCPGEAGEVVDTIMIEVGRAVSTGTGRKTVVRERRIPLCAEHMRSVEVAPNRATAEAQRKARADAWKARQIHLFDDLAYKVGGARRGWWEQ